MKNPELSGSAGTASLLPPDFLLPLQALLCRCCPAKLWQSSTTESSKSEWDETWANENPAPRGNRDHLIWEHHGQEDERPAGLLRSDPKQMEDVSVKTRAFWKRRQYFCFAQAIWPLLFVCFCYYKYSVWPPWIGCGSSEVWVWHRMLFNKEGWLGRVNSASSRKHSQFCFLMSCLVLFLVWKIQNNSTD